MKNKRAISPATFINSKITATISISLVLFLLGLIVLLFLCANHLSNYVKESFSFNVVLSDEVGDGQVNRLMSQLKNTPFVKSIEYISKQDAAQQLKADIGQDPEEFLGFNPLPTIIVVHLHAKYAEADSLPVIESKIKGFSTDIKDIEYRRELMQLVNNNLKKAGVILLGLSALLLFISFALINNTIRLTIYSRRFLIHTMKLVGATAGFIRKPFILSNVYTGIVAALVANALLVWLIFFVGTDLKSISTMLAPGALYVVFGSVLILGILISICATYFAVNRYIGMKGDDMYFV
ncbi:cell division protein FtsX [Bacteroidia bacterium]|nr:cell division protein FtsX [Bacteroidia bacterium]